MGAAEAGEAARAGAELLGWIAPGPCDLTLLLAPRPRPSRARGSGVSLPCVAGACSSPSVPSASSGPSIPSACSVPSARSVYSGSSTPSASSGPGASSGPSACSSPSASRPALPRAAPLGSAPRASPVALPGRGQRGGVTRVTPRAAPVVQTGPRRPLRSLPSRPRCLAGLAQEEEPGFPFAAAGRGAGLEEGPAAPRLRPTRRGPLPCSQCGRGALWAPAWVRGPGADTPPSATDRSRAGGAADDALGVWQAGNSPWAVEAPN